MKISKNCCLILQEGGVFTFGAGGYGQLGHNSTNHEINPRKVFELMGNVVTQIACGRLIFTILCILSELLNIDIDVYTV